MTISAESMGWDTRFGIGAGDAATAEMEVISSGLRKRMRHVESLGARGMRSHIKESVNEGTYEVGGPVVMEPRPDDLDTLLPYILGGMPTNDTFPLDDTLPEFLCCQHKVAGTYNYTGCKVNTAEFASGGPGQNLQLTLDIQGKTEAATTFPDIAATLSVLQPYILHQAVITLGSARNVKNLTIRIDNALILDEYRNSQTRQVLPEGDRIVTFECDMPFTADELNLYDLALAGVAGTVVFTNGTYSLTFTFANLKAPADSPTFTARNQPLPFRLRMQAYQSGATKELVVTNVNSSSS